MLVRLQRWLAKRFRSRLRLEDFGSRVQPRAAWEDLAISEAGLQTLREIVAQARDGAARPGIAALLAGPPGVGKEMAAEVVAGDLRLDLYRIDLSAVVSKYIGETEKNLRRLFDAAESGGALLFFDEADALFGKRSEVKDSHDRYANVEVNYLLILSEAYRGLTILATSDPDPIDEAVLRRIHYVVEFDHTPRR